MRRPWPGQPGWRRNRKAPGTRRPPEPGSWQRSWAAVRRR
ncbi:hypothetical protein DVDV_4235 [Desulfovibrio sp. DV]|nr:hypothetical protein DVDV_4235 [Desulfovibrio sp. DV]